MKICRLINEADNNRQIGFILYYENESEFIIEIDPELDCLNAPISLDPFIKEGHLTVDPAWSRRWVEQRIPPVDRQNMRSILADNKLKEYDAYRLLVISSGRCAQDNCAVQELRLSADALPEWMSRRFSRRIEYAYALNDSKLMLIYCDGSIITADFSDKKDLPGKMDLILERPDLFREAKRGLGGYGVEWPGGTFIYSEDLLELGTALPISKCDLTQFIQDYLADTAEVCRQLSCSRQYVSKLVESGTITPLLNTEPRLFTQGEIVRFKES